MKTRRKFLSSAAVATLSTPIFANQTTKPTHQQSASGLITAAAQAEKPVVLNMQSAFPVGELLNEFGTQWAERVNAISDGSLSVTMKPVGAVTSTFKLLPAVSTGTLDGGFTYSAYQHAMNPAISLWCTGSGFGMNSNMLLAWHNYGGGRALLERLYVSMKLGIESIPFMPLPNQPLGWFKKPLTKLEDLKGLRFRTAGLALDVYKELGAAPVPMAGSDIGPAIRDGKLDGGEFNNLTSDRALGINNFAPVCMVQSYAEATGCLELVFNKRVWSGLSPEHQSILRTVANTMSAEGPWQMAEKNSRTYLELAQQGTQFVRTPGTILQAQLNAWDRVLARYSASDALFAEIVNSQREYAKRVARWDSDVTVDFRNVYTHYFGRKAI